ncbi:ribulose phosphate epimerase [Mycolicibacterium sp. S2-37]|uniref:ribulose phosphate epimerase n=1 Tax=Mycolicibacterium sp. S2-37 TaxID=2810297 RepID=UPI001A94EE82|nr:ribulose phosphate epimerase [Mycolicibacterium sp. S2-37]MBO0676009.1 ribulose phosphate epimerase [Mycolicibacterium sp. S2-37]
MTRLAPLAPWYERFPGRIAGSVYAVAPADRAAIAGEMADVGLDVHVDVMAESEGLPTGVSVAELSAIAQTVDRTRPDAGVDVHLIGSPDFVDATLGAVLEHRPSKVFLPWAAFTEHRARSIRAAGGSAWIALWKEWNGFGPARWPATPDGVLVMLIEPGTTDRCRLDRLGIVTACVPHLPVIVDGGVTEDIAPLCITAGAESLVVGRALLPAPAKGNTP